LPVRSCCKKRAQKPLLAGQKSRGQVRFFSTSGVFGDCGRPNGSTCRGPQP
jgi:hypothetical protein